MMNGMNFFNLNTSNTPGSLFGSTSAGGTGSSATSTYKESCKYGSSTHDDEDMENEDDGERMMSENGTHHNSKSNSYDRNTERGASLVTGGEENAD